MNAPHVLVTGFEPFGGENRNPSAEVARALAGRHIGAATIEALELPCSFDGSRAALDAALERGRPRLVVALGQAAGRCEISIERVAVNLCDARIADNDGVCPTDVPVVAGAPAAYFSTLPVKAIVAALRESGIPAGWSMSAGTYVCNHLFYAMQHRFAVDGGGVRSGFIHLPLLPQQAASHPGVASLAFDTMVDGVRIAIETALAVEHDLALPGGTIA